jgi:hypothetical protein
MPHTSNAHWAGISSTGLITEGDFARQICRVISDAFDAIDDTNSTVDGRAMEPRAGSVPLAGARLMHLSDALLSIAPRLHVSSQPACRSRGHVR